MNAGFKNNVIPIGNLDDATILDGIRQGHSGAFRALYDHNADRVFRLAFQFLQNEAEAQNIVQETFIRVFRTIGRFRADSKLSTWIYRITCNLCLNEIKRGKTYNGLLKSFSETEMTTEKAQDQSFRHIQNQEQVHLVMKVVKNMEDRKRLTFHLFYVEEMKADDIADILEENRGTTLKRLKRIREEIVQQVGCEEKRDYQNKAGRS